MPSIVYQTDKKTGVKYAYESTSYWDKEKKQPRSTRKYIGKVDPETGEILRKKDRKLHSADASSTDVDTVSELEQLQDILCQKDREIAELKTQLSMKTKEYNALLKIIKKATVLLETAAAEDNE